MTLACSPMPPDYIAVLTASYDYQAQSDDEISITEGQVLLLIEKVDEEWWKVKIKAAQETESPVGLVPAAYVEQAEHSSVVRALYDYEATAPGELSVAEDDVLYVFETEDDWLLVQHSTDARAGYVPGNYVEVVDENAPEPSPAPAAVQHIIVPDSPPRPVAPYVDPADRVAQSHRTSTAAPADDIKTWAVSEIDKKGKKKKGTLGVGNGNVFFASESDKTPVQKWQTKDLITAVSEKAKHVRLDIGGASPTSLHFHAGSKDHAEAIIAKLELSKSLASPPITGSPPPESSKKASVHFSNAEPDIIPEPEDEDLAQEEEEEQHEEEEEEEEPEPAPRQAFPPPPKAAQRAIPQPVAAPGPADDVEEEAMALYDFTADGEDELSVMEGERLAVLEKDGDEWWKCRNSAGHEGVVPASYLDPVPGTAAPASRSSAVPNGAAAAAAGAARAAEARRAREAAEAAEAEAEAAAEAEAEADAEAERKRAAVEAQKQRVRKEAQEKARQAALASEAQRQERKNARAASPPVAQQSSRSKDQRTSSAAGSTNSKTSSEVTRPPAEKTRVWHDRSGQFRVEAAFLGFNNGKLRLHKVNGVIVEVPSEKMSVEDMRYVERFLKKAEQQQTRPSTSTRTSDDTPLAVVKVAQQKKKAPTIDWFDFFLTAGCDIDDCTRYASAFERDKIDEALLSDITPETMRVLGLNEGDIIRVRKAVARRQPGENINKPSAHSEEQLRKDEELARKLQAQEGGPVAPAPNLFSGPGGVLKAPRRGRPQPKNSVPANVDIKAIAGVSDQIQRTASPQVAQSPVGTARTATPVLPVRPASAAAAAAPLISGFDDDAWTNRPSSTKPIKVASPPPANDPVPVLAPAPPPQPTPTPTVTVAPNPPAPAPTATPTLAKTDSDIFEQLARLSLLNSQKQQQQPQQQPQQQQQQVYQSTPSPAFNNLAAAGYARGMGMGTSPVPMGQLSPPPMQQQQQQQQQPYNGARGPFAPVPGNQSLLQPLIPVPTQATGYVPFVPTKAPMNGGGPSPFGSGSMPMSLGAPSFLSAQPTGFVPQQQQQQQMQPMMTGYNPGFSPSPQPMMGQATFNTNPQPMMAQQTGAFGGFGGGASPFGSGGQMNVNGTGFGGAPLQSQMTGMRPPLNQSMFGPGPSSPPPVPPLPSGVSNNTSPANIFAQMKSGTFANDNDNSHGSNTGLNGQSAGWGQSYQGYTGY